MITKVDIIEILQSYMSEISGDVNCAYFNKIAKAIMDKINKEKYITKDEVEFENKLNEIYKD